jgi:hypothetical protein
MLAPLLTGLLLAAPVHDIAYIARYYYPYPDKRISRDQVYVSDIHGKNRLQLSTSKGEVADVHWVSETVVTWTETTGDNYLGYEYDIPHRKRKVVAPSPLPMRSFDDCLIRSDDPSGPSVFDFNEDTSRYELPGEPPIENPGATQIGENYDTVITRAGKTYHWTLYAGVFHFYKSRLPSQTWIVSAVVASSAGSSMSLYRADWKKNSLAALADHAVDFQLSSDENAWCALQGERPMTKYGPNKQVWTCQIRAAKVGGKEWIATPGLVFTKEFRLRPKIIAADF